MAKGDIRIPEQVMNDMRQRFELRVDKTVAEFDSADEDEDVMTGHLGANLTTHPRTVFVADAEVPGNWTWSLRYRKFRGRGPGATEKKLGADGILELILDSIYKPQAKSMLFQAKMDGTSDSKGLVEQCAKLSTWREAAAVFSYGRHQFQAFTLDAVLGAKGKTTAAKGSNLTEFLTESFVGCEVGDTQLRYDVDKKMLSWRNFDYNLVATRFAVKHRIRINVKASVSDWSHLQGVNEISADEIIKNRMHVDDRDMLGVDWDSPSTEMKSAQKAITKIYHPDLWQGWPDHVREAMEARTKEVQGVNLKKKS